MRIKGLDFLRGIAIIGVLFRHLEMDFWLSGPGGFGVDLFFVLSGFLVSGLLFKEYKRRKNAGIGRFLIRRGFKIYPSFYFFILSSILIYGVGFGSTFPFSNILTEIFFLQSYLKPMWSHTWSLAVEEHFYFLLALFIFLSIKFRWIENRNLMIASMSGMILLCLSWRLIYCITIYQDSQEPFYYTHLRIDGLITGALLGYLWHFQRDLIEKFDRYKTAFMLCALALLAPAFLLSPAHFFMVSIGFNMLHLAFAIAVLLIVSPAGEKMLFGNFIIGRISTAICVIGVYSYSIYLWHLPVQNLLLRFIPDLRLESAIYLLASIAVGILAAIVVEKPMLRIRDKYFPGN